MAQVKATALGASLPTNTWKEGQLIECHENIAALFIEKGYAVDLDQEINPDNVKMEDGMIENAPVVENVNPVDQPVKEVKQPKSKKK